MKLYHLFIAWLDVRMTKTLIVHCPCHVGRTCALPYAGQH